MQWYIDLLELDRFHSIEINGVHSQITISIINSLMNCRYATLYNMGCIICKCKVIIKNNHTVLLKSKKVVYKVIASPSEYEICLFDCSVDYDTKIIDIKEYYYGVEWEFGLRKVNKNNLMLDYRVAMNSEVLIYKKIKDYKYTYVCSLIYGQENGYVYLEGDSKYIM